ncbi:Charged multivesicular body protein 2A [Cichlidogyrus casuarinus]|uniref:Charged multivesicular body protein 2A n=1 Tax=Cichlidogyrus casuarinus TaxID=1844966 RepID=A0ABD2PP73_9PLAT
MNFLFGERKTPQQQMRECTRILDRANRDMMNEKRRLENDQKRIEMDIKNMAKKNQMSSVRILAKDLVRNRNQVNKLMLMGTNIQTMKLNMITQQSTAKMAEAMKKMTLAMQKMNKSINLPAMQKIMVEFEKQSEIMEMKGEMMNDVMEDVFEDDQTMEQTDEIVDKVLSELGIEMNTQLNDLNPANDSISAANRSKNQPTPAAAAADADPSDLDLEERLNRLKRN